jgi:hypothetical protein
MGIGANLTEGNEAMFAEAKRCFGAGRNHALIEADGLN